MAAFLFGTLTLGTDAARAGAWTLTAGEGQVLAVGTFSRGDRLFDPRGRLVREQDYRKFELPLFVEYGVSERLTVFAAPSLLFADAQGPVGSAYRGPGYADLGARFRLWTEGPQVVSVQATARLPGARDAANPAEIGWTDPETDLRLLWGWGFTVADAPAFLNVEAAYRVRAGGPADEFRLDVTFGVRPRPRWLLLAQSFSTVSVGSAAPPFLPIETHKVSLGVAYDFGVFTLHVGALAGVAGRNSLAERGVVAGLWYRF